MEGRRSREVNRGGGERRVDRVHLGPPEEGVRGASDGGGVPGREGRETLAEEVDGFREDDGGGGHTIRCVRRGTPVGRRGVVAGQPRPTSSERGEGRWRRRTRPGRRREGRRRVVDAGAGAGRGREIPGAIQAVVAKETLPTLKRAPEDGLLVVLEVRHLQDELPERLGVLDVVASEGEGELVLDPLVVEPAGKRIRVVPPHAGHEDVDLVMRRRVRADPDDERHRPASTSGGAEGPGQARERPARVGGKIGGREGRDHHLEEGPTGQGRCHRHAVLATEAGRLHNLEVRHG